MVTSARLKRALITGGAGFLGSAIVRALRGAGYATTSIGNTRDDRLTGDRLAALDPDLDVIVHCAGGSSVGASLTSPLEEFEKTVPPLAALLEQVRRRARTPRVVLLSSAAVYGHAEQVPTPETAAIAPISPYGFHKRMCEDLLACYGKNYGVQSVVVRLFSVYGPNLRKQLMWDACSKVVRGDLTFAGTGNEVRDWLHVEDAAALTVLLGAYASPDVPIYNGAAGVGVSVRDVVTQICEELGAGAPEFSQAARPGDPPRYIADVTRARSLGWAPKVEIRAGISQYVKWFKEHA
jgi:UDP-glucose 4-epimerase